MALSQASDLVQQVQELWEQMSEIQQMLQENASSERSILCQNPPRSVPNPFTRIPGTMWSEEMDIRDPIVSVEDGNTDGDSTTGQEDAIAQ